MRGWISICRMGDRINRSIGRIGPIGRITGAWNMKKITVALLLLVVLAANSTADDRWPQFRGPGSLGVAEDPALPDKWSTTENVTWKTDIPGMGWSSPTVW